jgi:3-phosphoshikimate 1-carboxyvinyltransferase
MKAIIHPSRLKGRIQAPSSKSSMQRALAAALIRKGESVILDPGNAEDDRAAAAIIQKLGATIEKQKDQWKIISDGINPIDHIIDCGESGLSIRMFTPIAALSRDEITITGRGSLAQRPMNVFDEVLPKLGVNIQTTSGKLPIRVRGPLKPANIEVDGSLSSQFLTGLLMAFSAAHAHQVSIIVHGLKSKPYIDLTIDVLKKFGLITPVNRHYREFIFEEKKPGNTGQVIYQVEADWSGAAFLLVAGAIAGRPVQVTGLDLSSSQADRKIIDVLIDVHAGIAIEAKGIKVMPANMKAFTFDATDCPDLFPPLVALAAYCNGNSIIYGVNRLLHKESNRAESLLLEFKKMGINIDYDDEKMIVHGDPENISGAMVHSHHDHRIAMALAVASLSAKGKTIIDDAGAVNKSYPGFYDDLKKLGADVSLDNKLHIHE